MTPAGRVTLAAIAEAAGVSVATVSRVLNGGSNVGKATRMRIEGLLGEYGYQARNKRARPAADTIHVIYPLLDSSWQLEHLRGMEAVLQEAGVGLAVSALDHGGGADDLMMRARAGTATGAILAAASGDTLLGAALPDLGVPVISLDPGVRTASRLPAIGAANFLGARAATEHLLGLGHRRIGMITATRGGLLCSRARLDGYRAALENAGVPEDPGLIRHGRFSFGAGVAAARELFDEPDSPTAIFASSDHIAMGVYEAARRRGLSIPDQLSVVGFDDLPASRWASPPLTTVRQPLEEMGRLAARTVLDLVRHRTLTAPNVDLGTRLVVRASTASRSG